MTRTKANRWSLGLLLAVLAIAPVLAQGAGSPRRGGPGSDGPGPFGMMAQALDLTADQQLEVRAVMKKHMNGALGDRLHSLRAAREQLRAVIHDAAATDQQVQESASAMSAIASQVAVERHHMATEVGKVLTAEQREKAARLRGEHREPPPDEGPDDF